MRLYITFSLLIAFTTSTLGQTSYSISPSSIIAFNAPYSQTTVSDVYQHNTGSSKIVLKWEKVLVNLPVGWTVSICDFGACYGTIPTMSTMDTVPVGGKGVLGLNVNPGTIPGSGVVKVYVYQNGYYSNGDTITWNITSTAVGIKEISLSTGISVFPLPTKDILNVNFKTLNHENVNAYIIDALGEKVLNISLTEQTNQINISKLSAGFYNLILERDSKLLFQRIIITD